MMMSRSFPRCNKQYLFQGLSSSSVSVFYFVFAVSLLHGPFLFPTATAEALVGCVSRPCGPHGSCHEVQFDFGAVYSCQCDSGWQGEHCDEPQESSKTYYDASNPTRRRVLKSSKQSEKNGDSSSSEREPPVSTKWSLNKWYHGKQMRSSKGYDASTVQENDRIPTSKIVPTSGSKGSSPDDAMEANLQLNMIGPDDQTSSHGPDSIQNHMLDTARIRSADVKLMNTFAHVPLVTPGLENDEMTTYSSVQPNHDNAISINATSASAVASIMPTGDSLQSSASTLAQNDADKLDVTVVRPDDAVTDIVNKATESHKKTAEKRLKRKKTEAHHQPQHKIKAVTSDFPAAPAEAQDEPFTAKSKKSSKQNVNKTAQARVKLEHHHNAKSQASDLDITQVPVAQHGGPATNDKQGSRKSSKQNTTRKWKGITTKELHHHTDKTRVVDSAPSSSSKGSKHSTASSLPENFVHEQLTANRTKKTRKPSRQNMNKSSKAPSGPHQQAVKTRAAGLEATGKSSKQGKSEKDASQNAKHEVTSRTTEGPETSKPSSHEAVEKLSVKDSSHHEVETGTTHVETKENSQKQTKRESSKVSLIDSAATKHHSTNLKSAAEHTSDNNSGTDDEVENETSQSIKSKLSGSSFDESDESSILKFEPQIAIQVPTQSKSSKSFPIEQPHTVKTHQTDEDLHETLHSNKSKSSKSSFDRPSEIHTNTANKSMERQVSKQSKSSKSTGRKKDGNIESESRVQDSDSHQPKSPMTIDSTDFDSDIMLAEIRTEDGGVDDTTQMSKSAKSSKQSSDDTETAATTRNTDVQHLGSLKSIKGSKAVKSSKRGHSHTVGIRTTDNISDDISSKTSKGSKPAKSAKHSISLSVDVRNKDIAQSEENSTRPDLLAVATIVDVLFRPLDSNQTLLNNTNFRKINGTASGEESDIAKIATGLFQSGILNASVDAQEVDDDDDDDEEDDDDDDDDQGPKDWSFPLDRRTSSLPDDFKIQSGRRTGEQRDELRSCVHWAVGLEHESMPVHRHKDSMEEYALDANKILREMARYGVIHGLTKLEHDIAVMANDDGAEFSGRRCSESIDLVFKTMMESVTTDARELSFDGAYEQLRIMDMAFLEMANRHPFIKKAMKDLGLGPVVRPMAGMSNQLGMYQRTGGKWHSFVSCESGVQQRTLKDYTGSYHMSISLPSTKDGWVARDESILQDANTCAPEHQQESSKLRGKITNPIAMLFGPSVEAVALQQQEEWIAAHQNLGNMIQWIEPLLVAVFGTADADAVCDAGYYTEGSFRSMDTGWGVPGTTDVRTFKDGGIGRYIKNNFEWIFPDETVAFPQAYREKLSGCMEDGMGADIRTKTTVDEHHWPKDKTLPRMEVGRGIEIRIFDNFPIEHVPQVYRMLVLVAEAGRHFTAPEYIYGNLDWHGAIQSVMRDGWNGVLPEGYIRSVAKAMNLSPSFTDEFENFQTFNVYSKLYQALWDAHIQGMWTILMLDDIPEELPTFMIPNRKSWEHGAINKGFTPSTVMDILGLSQDNLPRTVQVHEIKLSDQDCAEDHDDLIYLAESFGMASNITLGNDGRIASFLLHHSDEWDTKFITPPVCKANLGPA